MQFKAGNARQGDDRVGGEGRGVGWGGGGGYNGGKCKAGICCGKQAAATGDNTGTVQVVVYCIFAFTQFCSLARSRYYAITIYPPSLSPALIRSIPPGSSQTFEREKSCGCCRFDVIDVRSKFFPSPLPVFLEGYWKAGGGGLAIYV